MSGKNMQRKSLQRSEMGQVLEVESYVKLDSIFTIEKKMVAKVVAKLKVEKVDEVKMKLAALFEV